MIGNSEINIFEWVACALRYENVNDANRNFAVFASFWDAFGNGRVLIRMYGNKLHNKD